MTDLVSIITPCYNGEKYLDRYFNSLLKQGYPDVELIFVNDGSTDKTETVALEYGEKLKARGYGFTYIYQDNAGQSAAINKGLKLFKGEYLNWMDSDDYLMPDSIEKRVNYLKNNTQVGLVIGRTILVDDVNCKMVGHIVETGIDRTHTHQLVEDFLKGVISCTCCCSTMVRSSMFRNSMPDSLQIETPREIGQNYQLFLPIMFNYPVKYMTEDLAYYVVHNDSHSRKRKSCSEKLHAQDVAKDTLYRIAGQLIINDKEKEWFKCKIEEYDCKNRLEILQHYKKKEGLEEIIGKMKSLGCYDSGARKMVMKIKYPILKKAADRIWEFRNK